MQILAGNGTCEAARDLEWSTIRAELIDCTPAEAKRIVLVDNRASDLGVYDDSALVALLTEVQSEDLAGVGYSAADVEQLLALVAPPEGLTRAPAGAQPSTMPYATGEAELFRFILS